MTFFFSIFLGFQMQRRSLIRATIVVFPAREILELNLKLPKRCSDKHDHWLCIKSIVNSMASSGLPILNIQSKSYFGSFTTFVEIIRNSLKNQSAGRLTDNVSHMVSQTYVSFFHCVHKFVKADLPVFVGIILQDFLRSKRCENDMY